MSPQFIQARKKGKVAQKYVKGMFSSWGLKTIETKDGYHPDFDMLVSGKLHGNQLNFKCEIKWDLKAQETGNLYIDIQSLAKSTASILCICLNDPIDTVLMLPLEDALNYARKHANITGGEWHEKSALISKEQFIKDLKPKVLTTNK